MHGKVEAYNHLREKISYNLILLGDFCDSFDRSISKHVQLIEHVLEDAESGRTRFILGNHEMSYIEPNKHRCSGYKEKMDWHMQSLKHDLQEYAEPAITLWPDIVITHAGISQELWERNQFEWETIDVDAYEYFRDLDSDWHNIGRFRGGLESVGGPLWCDWNAEFVPCPDVRQILGHSSTTVQSLRWPSPRNFEEKKVGWLRTNDNGDWNVDCLDRGWDFLVYDGNGKLSLYEED